MDNERRVVYTYVVGDLFHIGHLRMLKQAKALGDYLIVGVLTDEAVVAYKRRPVIPFDERIEIISAIKYVDLAVKQESLDPTDNLTRLSVDILSHGNDWDEDFPGASYMRRTGKKVTKTRYYNGQSTTKIIRKMRKE